MQTKQAIILLGGKGTRISHLYPDLPKALIPVAGKSFLAWQLDWLFRNNIHQVLLAAGYKAEKIQAWVKQQTFKDKIKVMIEKQALGTGGAIKFAGRSLGSGAFLALNGDSILPELDFQKMAETHRKSKASATIAVAPIENAGRYGTVLFDNAGRIIKFEEKKSRTAGWVNGGVYLIEKRLLDVMPSNKMVSLEIEIFPRLAADGKLSVFQCAPPLLDMGTPEGLKNTENYLRASP